MKYLFFHFNSFHFNKILILPFFIFVINFRDFLGFWELLEKNPNPGDSGFFGRKNPNPRDFGFRNWDPKKSHPKATSATEYLSQICSEPEMRKFFFNRFSFKITRGTGITYSRIWQMYLKFSESAQCISYRGPLLERFRDSEIMPTFFTNTRNTVNKF